MKSAIVWLIGLLISAPACAAWEFSAPLDVSPQHARKAFYHLDAAGRRNIAANRDTVAVVWEDDHAGRPDAYIALKRMADAAFSSSRQLNAGGEAFAPGVTAVGEGFLAGWTEADTVWVRYVDGKTFGEPLQLSTHSADQLALAALDGRTALAVWTETLAEGTCIHAARLEVSGSEITAGRAFPVADCAAQRHQTQPTLSVGPKGVLVVWQDRSSGTNSVYASLAEDAEEFSAPVQINDTVQKSASYGSGSSAVNPVVASSDQGYWLAWLDKRADRAGYKIYSAHSRDGLAWSDDLKVQDDFGDETPQWSVSLAIAPGGAPVAVWSDAREDNGQDVYYGTFAADAWSDNVLLEPAAGALDQHNPAVAVDASGGLHLIWLHQSADGVSRIKYSFGRLSGD